MAGRLAGKTALITAAGQGIGHATAVAFHNEGARLWATDIDEGKLAGLATLERVTCRALDVRDADAVAAAAEEIGAVDVLFNCAGRVPHGAILDCEFTSYDPENDLSVLSLGDTSLCIQGDLQGAASPVRVQIPARDVGLSLDRPTATSFLNCLPVRVQRLQDAPDGTVFVDLDCGGQTLRSRITRLSRLNLQLDPGMALFALIKSVALDIRV